MIAFLFPGQGSQRPLLLAESLVKFEARELFDRASEHLGVDVLREDDENSLRRPEVVQRNLFLAGFAGGYAMRRAGVEPDALAGHSIGAIAAATLAGVLTFTDALDLVNLRGKAIGRIGPGFGMGAILGLSERDVEGIVGNPEAPHAIYVAAINAPDQIVIAGAARAVEQTLEMARKRGARRAIPLDVTVPSHTPLMSDVHIELKESLSHLDLGQPTRMLAANVDGRVLLSKIDVARDLADSVKKPVRWHDATQMLYERGVRCFVETFLGDVLTSLIEATSNDVVAISLQRMSLERAVPLARRYATLA